VRSAGGPLRRTVTDLGPLARALVRRRDERGALIELPYGAVADTPEAATHRAFTEALGSLAPNTLVVDIDRDRHVLIVHQLVPTADPAAEAKPLPEP
jgi:multisubunit Na+/H+ antiporter MnhE subunit